MKYLIFLILILSFCLGQVAKVSIFRPDIIINTNDLLIGLIVIIFFLKKFIRKEKINSQIIKPILLFSLIGLISQLINLRNFSVKDTLVGSLYLVRWTIYFLFSYIVYSFLDKKIDNKKLITKCLVITGIVTAILGLLQYFFFPDLRLMKELNWDPVMYRVVGTFFDPGFMGSILVLFLILIINIYLENKKKLYLFFIAIVYTAFILTYARSAYLMYILAILIISWLRKSWKLPIIAGIIFFLSINFIPKNTTYGTRLNRQETIWARFDSYKTAYRIFLKSPIIGIGFDNFRYAQIKYKVGITDNLAHHAGSGTDNSLLFVLTTTGIIGFIAYLYFLSIPIIGKSKVFWRVIVYSSLIPLIVNSFFLNSLFYPFVMEYLAVILGIVLKVKELSS